MYDLCKQVVMILVLALLFLLVMKTRIGGGGRTDVDLALNKVFLRKVTQEENTFKITFNMMGNIVNANLIVYNSANIKHSNNIISFSATHFDIQVYNLEKLGFKSDKDSNNMIQSLFPNLRDFKNVRVLKEENVTTWSIDLGSMPEPMTIKRVDLALNKVFLQEVTQEGNTFKLVFNPLFKYEINAKLIVYNPTDLTRSGNIISFSATHFDIQVLDIEKLGFKTDKDKNNFINVLFTNLKEIGTFTDMRVVQRGDVTIWTIYLAPVTVEQLDEHLGTLEDDKSTEKFQKWTGLYGLYGVRDY